MVTWTPELILGIIGAIGGTIGAYILIRRFLREKPKLKIEILKCIYELLHVPETRFSIEFNVDNTGDRGTQLKALDISFRYKGKLYKSQESLMGEGTGENFVDAHKSKRMRLYFFFEGLSIEYAPTIDCNFTLDHTHGKEKFSIKVPYPRKFFIPLSKPSPS